ncbi:hypothetical protein J7643_17755 [bacterium]|nr:hypothetical protein [bacterium]
MHQLGLSAADVAALLHREVQGATERLETFDAANRHAGLAPEAARELALIQYLHEFSTTLLEANNRKIAVDLVRLGVLTGTITRDGEAAF